MIATNCLNGQNFSYYVTVPGNQRYLVLENMSLSMLPNLHFQVLQYITHLLFLSVPDTEYTFHVLAITTAGDGEVSMPRSFTTLQAPPTSPVNATISFLNCSRLRISWSPPKCSNGEMLYMVRKKNPRRN